MLFQMRINVSPETVCFLSMHTLSSLQLHIYANKRHKLWSVKLTNSSMQKVASSAHCRNQLSIGCFHLYFSKDWPQNFREFQCQYLQLSRAFLMSSFCYIYFGLISFEGSDFFLHKNQSITNFLSIIKFQQENSITLNHFYEA